MFQNIPKFILLFFCITAVICNSYHRHEHDQELSSLSRNKRDAFDYVLKKKGLHMAAGALIAAASASKKKFMPIPIVFPLP